MRKLFRYICACCAILSTSSCDDFLDIVPMNDVVLENYWTAKADVQSVLNSCYASMQQEDFLSRAFVWSEWRSDNIVSGTRSNYELAEIQKENLLPTNSFCKWAAFYRTINRCNTVCHYAPEVNSIDPNYTETEMKANVAEATALRSLCYFYLIRTFRDVPFTREPSIDDTQNYYLPAMPFEEVLDNIIADLEAVKDNAVKRYYTDESPIAYYNSSKITRYAIYAMLADMYLWKGNYEKCIEHCNVVLDFKKAQYEEALDREGNITNIQLFNDYPLILEKPTGTVRAGNTYNEIFGEGNSFESIFELRFENNQTENAFIKNYYGTDDNRTGYAGAPSFLYKEVAVNNNTVFKSTDCRAYEHIQSMNANYVITKYVWNSLSFKTTNPETDLNLIASRRDPCYANWIFYRMTDVMLMKAEAEIEIGTEEMIKDAFDIISAVYNRANNIVVASSNNALKFSDYGTSKQAMQELVILERQRELLFEGKRWYDLVRLARRDGNTRRLVDLAIQKQKNNLNGIKIRLANPDIIYFPYAKDELKVNPNLKQNEAYNTGIDSEIDKN